MEIDPDLQPFYDLALGLGGMIFCARCGREAGNPSTHPPFTDESYFDLAAAMRREGWSIIGELDVACLDCLRKAQGGNSQ